MKSILMLSCQFFGYPASTSIAKQDDISGISWLRVSAMVNALSMIMLFFSMECAAQVQGLTTELQNNYDVMPTMAERDDFQKLTQIASSLSDRKVVALGEATHGTEEFLMFKKVMVQYLVTNEGFKNIVFESDFAGISVMNNYLITGEGNIEQAIKSMQCGPCMGEEFLSLVNWLREFNRTRSDKDKIRVFGCDMQIPNRAAQLIRKKVLDSGLIISESAKDGLDLMVRWGEKKLDSKILKSMWDSYHELNDPVSGLKSIGSDETTTFLLQCLETIKQGLEFKTKRYIKESDFYRDSAMAKNCEWIFNTRGNSKSIVSAHNLHITKTYLNKYHKPMGHYLANSQGRDYYALALCCNNGELSIYDVKKQGSVVVTLPQVSVKNSSDYTFGLCKDPNFFLDFQKGLKSEIISAFLSAITTSRQIGGNYHARTMASGKGWTNHKLIDAFDGVAFFRTTHARTNLNYSVLKPH